MFHTRLEPMTSVVGSFRLVDLVTEDQCRLEIWNHYRVIIDFIFSPVGEQMQL